MRFVVSVCILVVLLGLGTANGQGENIPRISVIISGDDIASNDVLYDFADKIDLDGIAALASAHQEAMIPSELLHARLPQPVSGWTQTDTDHGQLSWTGGIMFSMAEADYAKTGADATLQVLYYDSVNEASGPWAGWWAGWGFDFENSEGYARSGTYKGHPTWETRDKQGNAGVVAIGLAPGTQIPELNPALALMAFSALVLLGKKLF